MGLLAVGDGPVPYALSGFLEPIPYTGLSSPALIQEEELILP